MENTTSLKNTKASKAKPNRNPSTVDKTLGLEPVIHLYDIEGGDKTE